MDIKDEIVQELGIAIGSDEALPTDWEALWTVFKIDGNDVTEFGQVTDSENEQGFLLDGDGPGDLAVRLRDVMINDEGKSWVACKVTLVRETRDINIKFEWDNPHIWDTPLPF